MSQLGATEVADRIVAAHERRRAAGLGDTTTAYRLVHDAGDALPDLRIERIGDFALVKYRDPWWAQQGASAIVEGLRACGLLGATFVFDAPAKMRTPAHQARDADLVSEMENQGFRPPAGTIVATENGHRYALSARDGYSAGLFFDMRDVRADLAAQWRGRKVLNLFAYTCGFGVALADGNTVTNVDTSKRYLDWGRENYALNDLETPNGTFVRKDAFGYLEIAAKVGNQFDAIVLDPPSFSTGKKGKARRFALRDDLEPLIASALSVLAPGGECFVSTNWEGITPAAFASLLRRLGGARGLRLEQTWPPAVDFPPGATPYHLKTGRLA